MIQRGVITLPSEYALQMRKDRVSNWFPECDCQLVPEAQTRGAWVICIVPPTSYEVGYEY